VRRPGAFDCLFPAIKIAGVFLQRLESGVALRLPMPSKTLARNPGALRTLCVLDCGGRDTAFEDLTRIPK
jgi:hypothetical protein